MLLQKKNSLQICDFGTVFLSPYFVQKPSLDSFGIVISLARLVNNKNDLTHHFK